MPSNHRNLNVLKRLKDTDNVLSVWMRDGGMVETTPEECYDVLVSANIYPSANKARSYRADLRKLKNIPDEIPYTKIIVEQGNNQRWHIRLK